MPILTITKTYADGQVLTEADLDNIKDSIQTFINTTKLDGTNIQDDSISEDKLTPAARLLLVPTGVVLDYGGTSAPGGYVLAYGQEISQVTFADLFAVYGTTFNTGGEAIGNFRVPDCRGRATFGKDNMGGTSANRITAPISGMDGDVLATTGGDEATGAHTHTVSGTSGTQSANHTHTFSETSSYDGSHRHKVAGTIIASPSPQPTFQCFVMTSPPTSLFIPDYQFTHGGGFWDTIESNGAHTHTVGGTTSTVSADHTHSFSATTSSTGAGASGNIPPAIILNRIVKT